MPGKQNLFAFAASGMLELAFGRYAIDRIAVGTDDVQCAHKAPLVLRFGFLEYEAAGSKTQL